MRYGALGQNGGTTSKRETVNYTNEASSFHREECALAVGNANPGSPGGSVWFLRLTHYLSSMPSEAVEGQDHRGDRPARFSSDRCGGWSERHTAPSFRVFGEDCSEQTFTLKTQPDDFECNRDITTVTSLRG